MSDLSPIPAEQRRAYYDALRAGCAEAERLGYGPMDDRMFAAFHRALYRPMTDAARADERAKTAEQIADALYARSETPTAEGDQDRWQTYRDAAAIAREHAVRMPQDAATGTAAVSTSGDSTDSPKGAQGLSGGPDGGRR